MPYINKTIIIFLPGKGATNFLNLNSPSRKDPDFAEYILHPLFLLSSSQLPIAR